MTKARNEKWFENCGGWSPRHRLDELRAGITKGLLNEQDEYGSTALSLAASSGWIEGVNKLIGAGADTELRHARTGETALYGAVEEKHESIILALLKAGANPDAAGHSGYTPRKAAKDVGLSHLFKNVPARKAAPPAPQIQNAEHLADHYHPRFKIPKREERETLQPGQAVNLYVYGPESKTKQNTVKVRIRERRDRRPNIRYVAVVETPLKQTHLPPGTKELQFGPEHVATVYIPRDKKPKKRQAA